MSVSDERVEEALGHITLGLEFAYEKGLHEFGYDPVVIIRARLDHITEEKREEPS